MSYLLQEPTNFINIKLTDEGRRFLSLGKLTFDKYAFSDREVDYGFSRDYYNINSNKIISPKDANPQFDNNTNNNFDGSPQYALTSSNVGSTRMIVTADTNMIGFFSGQTDNFTIEDSKYCLGVNEIDYNTYVPSGTSTIFLNAIKYAPKDGDLVYIPWQPIQNSGVTNNTSSILSGNPIVGLWYRVVDSAGFPNIDLDREVPTFGTSSANVQVPTFFFPFNGVENTYGSASTIDTKIWNMNIIRMNSEPGTSSLISGYTTYGSIEYNGTKMYFGFSSDTREIGIIHYTNQFTGNTYAEQLVERTVEIEIPTIMWHKKTTVTNGLNNNPGIRLTDSNSYATVSDLANQPSYASQSTYRYLTDESENVVGRVYHKLKMIVITDPELLTALTYKSNRNYTLPALDLGLSVNNSGLIESGNTYFVTYRVESDSANTYSYGYPKTLPCAYIKSISGNNPTYKYNLTASFPPNSFPYLRTAESMTGGTAGITGGTGWNANKVQIIVNAVSSSLNPKEGNIPMDGWKLISDGVGNGIFTGTSTTINPSELQGHNFIITKADYTSGTTYVLDSAFTDNMDYSNSYGLTFGNESFFFGTIKSGILSTTFKSVVICYAANENLNSSLNKSWDGLLDEDTYITEIGIFKTAGVNAPVLVGLGKPSYPIKKSVSRYLVFQLEIDF